MQLATDTRPQVRRDRLLRLPEVEAATGLKKSTLYQLMKQRAFVPSLRITARCVAWPESKVLQWVQDRIAVADQQAALDGIGQTCTAATAASTAAGAGQ